VTQADASRRQAWSDSVFQRKKCAKGTEEYISMSVYARFNALHQLAVQKSMLKPKKKGFSCVGALGNKCSSKDLPHKGLGMCRNCHFTHYYHKSESAAHASPASSNAEQQPPPDKATLLRWYEEAGNNASEAARRNLQIDGNCHTLAKRIRRAVNAE